MEFNKKRGGEWKRKAKSLHRVRPDRVGVNAGHRGHREEKGKRRENVALGRKNPPFLQSAQKGWGTRGGVTKRKAPASEGGRY
jgi:hypothetical protein